jgi:hypothetical protein
LNPALACHSGREMRANADVALRLALRKPEPIRVAKEAPTWKSH